jgi:sodium transport system ATP-binding protein
MIVVQDLWKTFPADSERRKEHRLNKEEKTVTAVSGINFTCRPGRIFTLLGPNGAGKTTTLRMIATLMKPTRGSISVAGFDVGQQPLEVRRNIGFLTGSTKLYERLTAEETVKYYADLHGMDRGRFSKRKDELFTLLGINEFAARRVGKLSTGMRQKVSIARTMIHDPAVVVFDEPTVGLDVITSRHIIDLIRSCKSAGKTVIFSTHIMGEVSLLADDLAIIHNGKLCYNGTYDDFHTSMKGKSLEEAFMQLVEEADR